MSSQSISDRSLIDSEMFDFLQVNYHVSWLTKLKKYRPPVRVFKGAHSQFEYQTLEQEVAEKKGKKKIHIEIVSGYIVPKGYTVLINP